MSKKAVDQLKDRGLSVSAQLSAGALGFSASAAASTTDKTSERRADESLDKKVVTYVVGGRPPKDPTDPSSIVLWSKTVEDYPMPVREKHSSRLQGILLSYCTCEDTHRTRLCLVLNKSGFILCSLLVLRSSRTGVDAANSIWLPYRPPSLCFPCLDTELLLFLPSVLMLLSRRPGYFPPPRRAANGRVKFLSRWLMFWGGCCRRYSLSWSPSVIFFRSSFERRTIWLPLIMD